MVDRAERNLTLYPAFVAVFAAHFWLPVFFLYFQAHFTLAEVLRLEAIYYFAVFALELPSGYFSDAAGRRVTLIIAAASTIAAHALFLFSESYIFFAAAQIFLAGGIAFNSGTNTALHYDTLARLDRTPEYDDREARAAHWSFRGSGTAALVGGLCAAIDLRFAYGLSLLGGLVALGLTLAMVEPNPDTLRQRLTPRAFFRQVILALKELRQPALCWLSAYGVLMIVLNHLPYEFYQPYLDQLLQSQGFSSASTPVSTGIITLVTMVIAGQVAGQSIHIRNRIGLAGTLLLGTALQAVIIGAMAYFIHPLVAVLILLRSCPRAIMTAPLNAAITPRIGQDHRATFLSLESLAGRLAFSGVLWSLSHMSASGENGLSGILQAATVLAIAAFIVLALTSGLLNKEPPQRD